MQNQTLIQYFHWYYNEEQNLWAKVANDAVHLKEMGVTTVWLPPAYKGSSGGYSVGYDAYDLFDLGEFEQKGSTATKYGNKDELLNAITELHEQSIGVLADAVFNHKAGGDELEKFFVKRVDENDRTKFTSDPFEIEAWTKFTFPGRGDTYSNFKWDFRCFSGIDWANDLQESAIFSIQNEVGDDFEDVPSDEMGNYDYLMYNDIDFRNRAVVKELKYWGEWMVNSTGIDGFRLDAVKHISPEFIREWIEHLNAKFDRKFFIVAENWDIVNSIQQETYMQQTDGGTQLFDTLLHRRFYLASKQGKDFDLSSILNNTLMSIRPELAVTFVDNHDSQPLQSLESYVDFWFRPIAYAIILLRAQGIPCLFFPDVYGGIYDDKDEEGEDVHIELAILPDVEILSRLRAHLAYGDQHDYFDHPNCIGWTREGDDEHEHSGLAVVASNSDDGFKTMDVGKKHCGKTFVDALNHRQEEITIDKNGNGGFPCNGGSVSVWVLKGG